MKSFDIVFITNLPAFYKVNLFNGLSKHLNIKVIFVSNKSNIRNNDFFNFDMNFEHVFLSDGNYEDRNKFLCSLRLAKELASIKYEKLIYPGWEIKEFFFNSLFTNKNKNAIAIESSVIESDFTGLKGKIKYLYIKRMSSAYPAGFLQNEILKNVIFKGDIHITHGVGIINHKLKANKNKITANCDALRYIYIGRLSHEKNLKLLIEVFNQTGIPLKIVGEGPQSNELKQLAEKNIEFTGYIKNEALSDLLLESDVFILPSIVEPWGLVVEEALAAGLPVIVSDKVGCNKDIVKSNNGIVFNSDSAADLKRAINDMSNLYLYFKKELQSMDINENSKIQIDSYTKSLSK